MEAQGTPLFVEPHWDNSDPEHKHVEVAPEPDGTPATFEPGHWYFFSTDMSRPVKQLWIFHAEKIGPHPYNLHRRAFGQLMVITVGIPDASEPQWEPYFAQEPDFLHWTDITASAGVDPGVLHALADAS
ncbi:hypothetical protein [Streptomyces sp. NPDC058268]|uniref:hypothetical protein n=1 Tax=Streptomyces sp. NPDC058268 TaxID=3346413 RepID=UPI0036E0EF75